MEALTNDEIEAGRTEKGGFTKRQLAKWGVPWPPPSGWKSALMNGEKVEPNEELCFVGFTLTPELSKRLKAASDLSAIDRNHYALIMLSKMIERGEFLRVEDWWRGTSDDLVAHKRQYTIEDAIG